MLADDSNFVCETCGQVAEEISNLVGEQQFTEGPGGRISATGVQVAPGQTHARAPGSQRVGHAGGAAPKQSGKAAKDLAGRVFKSHMIALGIVDDEVERAAGVIFEIAHKAYFFRGRSLRNFASVCLYLALRKRTEQVKGVKRPKHAVLLLDLAEHENTDVFALGATYRDLVNTLFPGLAKIGISGVTFAHEELLAHGPEMFIDRFVEKMEFPPDAKPKIKMDAVRIVRRMNRDWMSTGRRPAGVCGAAVLLAARMNNYRRSVREVVLQAKVHEITINKRLEEFRDTASGKLSVHEFRDNAVLESLTAENPPAFTQGQDPPKLKRKRGRPRKNAPETAAEIEDDDSDTQVTDDQPLPKRPRVDAEGFAIPDLPQRASATPAPAERPKRKPGRPPGAPNWRAPPISPEEQAIEDELERDVDLTLEEIDPTYVPISRQSTPATQPQASPASDTSQQELSDSQATTIDTEPVPASQASTLVSSQQASQAQGEGVPLARRKRNEPPGPPVNTNIGNLNTISLSPTLQPNEFSDDEDVASCLLSEEEQKFKEVVWVNNNADWLRQDHAKRIKRELADAQARREGRDPDQERLAKLNGQRQTRKDGKPRQGKRGDPNSYLDPSNKPTDPNNTYRQSPATSNNGPPASDNGSIHSTRSTPSRQHDAAESVKLMLQHRGMHTNRINLNALSSIYGTTTASSPTSSSRSPSVSLSPQVQRRRSTMSGNAELNPENVIFGAQGGKYTGLARSKSSLSAERREARKRLEREAVKRGESIASYNSGGSGSPTPGPSGTAGASAGAGVGVGQSRGASVANSDDVQTEDVPSEPDVTDPTLGIPLLPIGRPEKIHRVSLPGKPPGLSGRRPRRTAPRAQTQASSSPRASSAAQVGSPASATGSVVAGTTMSDGSTEERLGSMGPQEVARSRGVSVASDVSGQIQMRDEVVDEDELSEDSEDVMEEGEDEGDDEIEVDLEDVFEGRYRNEGARGGE